MLERFGGPGDLGGGAASGSGARLRLQQRRDTQWWLAFLRRVGGSRRINTAAMDSYIRQTFTEEPPRRLALMPLAWLAIATLRSSRAARQALVRLQERFNPRLYSDLFESRPPDLVVASTPGWRMDRYLLREARARGIPTAAAIVGWDNPSSYSIPGSRVDYVTCWSDLQKEELVLGSDWRPEQVHVGGIPSYDGYFRKQWLLPRDEYFRLHGLDPNRKLLSYACSFVSFSPNLQNIEALARHGGLGRAARSLRSCWSGCTPTTSGMWTCSSTSASASAAWRARFPMCMSSSRCRWAASSATTRARTCRRRRRCWPTRMSS